MWKILIMAKVTLMTNKKCSWSVAAIPSLKMCVRRGMIGNILLLITTTMISLRIMWGRFGIAAPNPTTPLQKRWSGVGMPSRLFCVNSLILKIRLFCHFWCQHRTQKGISVQLLPMWTCETKRKLQRKKYFRRDDFSLWRKRLSFLLIDTFSCCRSTRPPVPLVSAIFFYCLTLYMLSSKIRLYV